MPTLASASEVTEAILGHPQAQMLIDRVTAAAVAAATRGDRDFLTPGSPCNVDLDIDPKAAETAAGNVAEVMARGPEGPEEGWLIGALVALGVSRQLPESEQERRRLVAHVIWLATHTPCDALSAIDDAAGAHAAAFWHAVAQALVAPADSGLARAEAIVAAGALAGSRSEAAAAAARDVSERVGDPTVARILEVSASATGSRTADGLSGVVAAAPRNVLATVVLGLTGILFASQVARLVGRLALGLRRPATLRISERGLEVTYRTEMLGKVLRDRVTVIPVAGLSRVTREVRYARTGLYTGLLALVLGSYLGMGLVVDGLRVPGLSPPLLGLGVLFVAAGLIIDFALSTAADDVRGTCRIVIEPRRGRRLCIGALDPSLTDRVLAAIAERASRT